MTENLTLLAEKAKKASVTLYNLDEKAINNALNSIADAIMANKEYIKKENAKDISFARSKGLPEPFIDRLYLSDKIIDSVAEGIKDVAKLKSPVDKVVYSYKNRKQGITTKKVLVPFGVIGMIYEARPNVTVDAFALAFKTKNAVILKGGKEAINSNIALVKTIRGALEKSGIDKNAVSLIKDTSRKTTIEFMGLKGLDLLIPRGSASLINSALENAKVPIIETGTGNCHIYVDEFANLDNAAEIILNAKTQRYGVCNACESLVINSKVLKTALIKIYDKLKTKQVEMRCDDRAYKVLKDKEYIVKAKEEDFYTEFLAPVISVKTVDSLTCAIKHINKCSTHHSESIITENKENAEKFLREIDSASVFINASTRFTDGFMFGLGAEIGISTQKLHARGPMGLEALVTTKYITFGEGAIRK